MALDLADYWVWDFWLADERTQQHLFYLHAPRTEDPEDRHQQARIGHAVSQDLRSWTVLPRPLPDSAPGAIDDRATWTGSTILDHDGR